MTPARHASSRVLLVFALTLLGLIGVGRLALEAWMNVPAPTTLPEVGARTEEARPFLLVIIDGLREDAAWGGHPAGAAPDHDAEGGLMPWLRSFAARGAWGVAIAGEPTLTAPCVRTLLTGRRPDLLTGFRNFNARPVRGSIIGYLHDRGAHTAHGGDAAAFQFCRDAYVPIDVMQFPDQGPVDQGACDALALPHVRARLDAGANCITLHLTKPDHAGHKFGAMGPDYAAACRAVDGEIRGFVTRFLARWPTATVLIAADHGVSSMGTHGGGEAVAKRAPFVLVGPGVAHVHLPSKGDSAPVDQCALAPSVCALLGLPQPPLADAPPDRRLLDLPEEVEQAALEAYVQARLIVARDLHGDAVDVIERERAKRTVAEMAGDVNRFLRPNAVGNGSMALLVALLWLVVLVALVSKPSSPTMAPPVGAPPVGTRTIVATAACAVGFGLAFDTLPLVPVTPPVAGALVLLGCLVAAWGMRLDRWRGAAITIACLASMPIITGSGLTLQETFTGPIAEDDTLPRTAFALAGLAFLGLVFFRPKRLGARLREAMQTSPGLVAAFGGVFIGFTLTLRPFIDPYLRIRHAYAALGVVVVAWMVRSRGLRGRPLWERAALAVVGLVLFVATRVAEGDDLDPWVNGTPMRGALWLAIGAALVVAMIGLVPRPRREDRLGVGLALAALLGAFFLRLEAGTGWLEGTRVGDVEVSMLLVLGVNAVALAALVCTLVRGSADGRLLVRLLAAAALARRLSVMDAEFAVFAMAGVGAALAARGRIPTGRVALAWLAVGILALRTAVFHAMGFEESFSTIDVGQAFAGLGGGEARALDAAGGAVITWQMMVAIVQLALRMALPWVLILAALMRSVGRTPGASVGMLRCVLGDLALSFAARGAAIATALWAWWRNNWWMTKAYTVYAYAAADVILLLLCATLCGAWLRGKSSPAGEDREEDRLHPSPALGMMDPWSA